MADLNEFNDTELRAVLREQGLRLPYYVERQTMEDILAPGPASSDVDVTLEPCLIESWRYYIMDWAAKNWEDVYYQVECPLQQDGCVTCPDFTVVSCLVHNRHVFNLEKEVEPMPMSWTAMMVSLNKSERTQAAAILRENAKEKHDDTRANRLALMKVATAAFDLANGLPTKPVTAYMSLTQATFPPEVKGLADDGATSIPAVLNALADLLESGSTAPAAPSNTEEKKPEKKAKPAEKKPEPYYPGVQDASAVTSKSSDDDDDDDDDDAPAPPKPVSDDAPLPPKQDAAKFAKGQEKPKATPAPAAPPTPQELQEIAKEPLPKTAPSAEMSVRKDFVFLSAAQMTDIRDIVRGEIRDAFALVGASLSGMFGMVVDAPATVSEPAPKVGKGKQEETIPEMDGDDEDD